MGMGQQIAQIQAPNDNIKILHSNWEDGNTFLEEIEITANVKALLTKRIL